MRYIIELAYNGTNFHGWQKQLNARTVQQELEEKLFILLKNPIETLGCGRTDTGVHAKQFFAHFDLDELLDAQNLVYKLNRITSKDIAIKLTNKEGTKDRNLNLQVYYFVTNLLNTQNVNSVWPYTGSVKDDGFLNSPKGQQALQTQLSADAYRFYYNTAVNNPGFYQGPRFMRLGAKLFF